MRTTSDVNEVTSGRKSSAKSISGERAESLTERTYEQLRRDILTCVLEPGSEVSEADLAERMQVSKTPVREALGRLRIEGFVKTYPRRGYQILPLTIADMDELFDMRSIVEGGCGALACQRISEASLARLSDLADASYDNEALDTLERFISANRDFHMAIAAATGNRRIQQTTSRLLDELERFFYVGARHRDVNPEVHADHHRIVAILRSRDPEAARKIMVEHNELTRRGLLQVIANGAWGSAGRMRVVVG